MYPLIVVPDTDAQRDWYGRHLGFSTAIDIDWFVYVTSPAERPLGLSFMREGLDLGVPGFRTPLTGDALVITIEVEDAEVALREVEATGATPVIALRDEPWGQRHFMLRDAAGIWVDIVQETEPDPTYFPQSAREARTAALDELRG